MEKYQLINQADIEGKKILLRVDFNVPIEKDKILDDSRIKATLSTIEYLLAKQAKLIIISHLGRPKGKKDDQYSLKPVADHLAKVINRKVEFIKEDITSSTDRIIEKINHMMNGDVVMLENLRFHAEEEKNDDNFCQILAKFADIYVNDAFACSHRDHASITGICKYLPSYYMGFLFAEEIESLNNLLANPQKPIAAIIGGSKISSKLKLIYKLSEKIDYLIASGGIANSLLAAQNINIGNSLYEPDLLEDAKAVLSHLAKQNCKIILPTDAITAKSINHNDQIHITNIKDIADDQVILDIGPYSITEILAILKNCKTLIWNGPLGVFETPPFNTATDIIARAAALLSKNGELKTIAGGGDSILALKNAQAIQDFSYISTAGGAFLELLENGDLPALKFLKANEAELR